MLIVVHSNYPILNINGNMLNGVGDVSIKDFLHQMVELKNFGVSNGLIFKTSREILNTKPDGYLLIDLPKPNDRYLKMFLKSNKPLFLLVWESGIINPGNINNKQHEVFTKIFTYDDTVIDNIKYFKIAYSFKFPSTIPKEYKLKKLCCTIAGNKSSNHLQELYSKRIELIKWFELNHPDEFDLYGQGWTKIIPAKNLFERIFNKFSFIHSKRKPIYKTYRGIVDDKIEVYKKYRFAVCYENARDIPGYISEKIFDCLFSGCVPIYWGASNISKFIPNSCFIDRRKFLTHESLYNYIKNISEEEYFKYLISIQEFLNEESNGVFSVDYFKKTIVNNILNHIEN